jgi:hypothetical protein
MEKTQVSIDKETRNELRQVQGKYGCLTFNEAILTLIDHDIGVPFDVIKNCKTLEEVKDLSKRWGK